MQELSILQIFPVFGPRAICVSMQILRFVLRHGESSRDAENSPPPRWLVVVGEVSSSITINWDALACIFFF